MGGPAGWDDDEPFEPLEASPAHRGEAVEGQQPGAAQQAQRDHGGAAQQSLAADGWGGEEFGEGWNEGYTTWTEAGGQAIPADTQLPQHAQQEGLGVGERAAVECAPRPPRALLQDLDAAASAALAAGSRPSSGLEGEGPWPPSGAPSTAGGEGLLAQLQQQLGSLTKAYQQQQEELADLKAGTAAKDAHIAQLQVSWRRSLGGTVSGGVGRTGWLREEWTRNQCHGWPWWTVLQGTVLHLYCMLR